MTAESHPEKVQRWILRLLLASTLVGAPLLYYFLFIVPVTRCVGSHCLPPR